MDRKIKVIRIIARLNIGGPAIHTVLLTEGLDKDEFQTILVTGRVESSEGDMQYYAHKKNVCPIIIPQLQRKINFFNDFIAFAKIYRLIKREKPDIIHTHTAKAGALGRLAGIMYNATSFNRRCRLIHTFHGTILQGYFGKITSKFFIGIERILAYFTDCIIVVSQGIKEELLKFKIGDPQRIAVIPLGLELEELLTTAPARSNSLFKVGIIGRLVPVKNHRLFLEAVKIFSDTQKLSTDSCRFFVIGDGKLRRDLEDYATKLGIDKFVEFLGWTKQVSQIYGSLDTVVLTSLNEGTPVSLIEAMAAARPVIATDVGGVKDLFIRKEDYIFQDAQGLRVYDNGVLCKTQDPQCLAEAFSLLASDRILREKMGSAGREFVKSRFSKERLIRDIEILYNNCLKRRGR